MLALNTAFLADLIRSSTSCGAAAVWYRLGCLCGYPKV